MAKRKRRKSLHPNVALRPQADGSIRPRYIPGPAARAQGAVGRDLKNADGSWMTLAEVVVWCKTKTSPVMAGRDPAIQAAPTKLKRFTVNDLLDDFFLSKDFLRPQSEGGYSDKTRSGYQTTALAIRFKPSPLKGRKLNARREPEPFADEPARALDAANVKAFFEYLEAARGLAMARSAIMVLSAAFKWGRTSTSWRLGANPCHQLGLASPGADVGIFEHGEFLALRASADELGRFSIRFACALGLFSPGRPEDVRKYTGGGIADGMVRLVQGKRGSRVSLPVLPVLAADLAEAHRLRLKSGWQCPELVVDERTGQGYTSGDFNDAFAAVRDHAAVAMPSLANKKFKYFRKTLYTWLYSAGNDVPTVGKLLGHSPSSAYQMADHYLFLNDAVAREAMGKLETWMQKQGMTG